MKPVVIFLIASLLTIGCSDNPAEPTQSDGLAQADLVNGGALYDKWWVVADMSAPDGDHPAMARMG